MFQPFPSNSAGGRPRGAGSFVVMKMKKKEERKEKKKKRQRGQKEENVAKAEVAAAKLRKALFTIEHLVDFQKENENKCRQIGGCSCKAFLKIYD